MACRRSSVRSRSAPPIFGWFDAENRVTSTLPRWEIACLCYAGVLSFVFCPTRTCVCGKCDRFSEGCFRCLLGRVRDFDSAGWFFWALVMRRLETCAERRCHLVECPLACGGIFVFEASGRFPMAFISRAYFTRMGKDRVSCTPFASGWFSILQLPPAVQTFAAISDKPKPMPGISPVTYRSACQ